MSARSAVPGETIATVLADGRTETTNTAKAGDMIVTNPGGEQYIVSEEAFHRRYQATSEPGVWAASGTVRAFRNPTGRDIVITAPWGEDMTGDVHCWVVEADPGPPPDRYIIGDSEFTDTYEILGLWGAADMPDIASREPCALPSDASNTNHLFRV